MADLNLKRRRSTPKIEAALTYLRSYLLRRAGDSLPSHYALARACGVSHVTMLRAMRRLAVEGVLDLHPRRRAAFPGAPVPPRPQGDDGPLVPRPPWKQVREDLARDLLRGDYGFHTILPPYKQLTRRYGVSSPTLRRALRKLAAEDLLRRHGRGYRYAASFTTRPHSAVALIVLQSEGTLWLGAHDDALIASLQRESVRANWELIIISFNRESGSLRFLMEGGVSASIAELNVLGFIFVLSNQERGFDEEVMRTLASTGKPVALLDQVGDARIDRMAPGMPAMKVFRSIISSEPGREVARYLLNINRTRVAFVAPRAQYAIAERRLAGLRAEFERAGPGATVNQCMEDLEPAAERMKADVVAEFHHERRLLQQHLSPMANSFLERCFADERLVKGYIEEMHLMHRVMDSLNAAIQFHNVNAIVTVGDFLIPGAARECKRLRRRIPADIALVSFDDFQESRTFRVPSYNFDVAAIGSLMSSYVLWPNKFGEFHKGRIIDAPGYLVLRGEAVRA